MGGRSVSRVVAPHTRLVPAGMVAAALGITALSLSPVTGHAGPATPTFGADYVSTTLAGGEPFVIYSHSAGDLVYAAHEGTTHIDRNGLTAADSSCDVLPPGNMPSGFVCAPYDNHINQWYSTDGGVTWTYDQVPNDNPLYTGFSDPSLTEDAPDTSSAHNPQNVYDTGIDLANDAVYASSDGGKTWVAGTSNCSEGDRPWLAGGHNGEVFMATDLEAPAANGASGHAYFHGLLEPVGGPYATLSCNPNAIQDPHGGDAQDYYDHSTGDIIEGDQFSHGGNSVGEGIGVLKNASAAWPSPASDPTNTGMPTGSFVDSEGTNCTNPSDPNLCTELGPIFPQIAVDQGNTTYVVWATNPRSSSTTDNNGCTGPSSAGPPAILPNSVYMIYTTDEGKTWSQPLPIATPATTGGTTVIWPFAVAGAAGNVSVAWYQSDQLTDPDCDSAALQPGGTPTKWTIRVANIFGATSAGTVYPPTSVNAVPNFDGLHAGGVFHAGGVCQSGTTCVATGQDRRLGDYFTTALDQNGCVMIATADTQLTDTLTGGQLDLSRPLFLQQASGPSLTNPNYTCSTKVATGPSTNTPEAPVVPGLLFAGLLAGGGAAILRRRRRWAADV